MTKTRSSRRAAPPPRRGSPTTLILGLGALVIAGAAVVAIVLTQPGSTPVPSVAPSGSAPGATSAVVTGTALPAFAPGWRRPGGRPAGAPGRGLVLRRHAGEHQGRWPSQAPPVHRPLVPALPARGAGRAGLARRERVARWRRPHLDRDRDRPDAPELSARRVAGPRALVSRRFSSMAIAGSGRPTA